MERNFWKKTYRPVFALAPMEDVTDTVFREIVLELSDEKCLDIVFTEFTSVDGLLSEKGREKVIERFFVNDSEKELLNKKKVKLVAQIWGSDPDKFLKVANELAGIPYFDGIDINMGCPVKKVVKNKTCSALIKFPELAKEIIQATKEGSKGKPVSVKTRIGFNDIDTEKWIAHLLEVSPAAITVHGRTQKQMSEGKSCWSEIKKAKQMRDQINLNVAILGNGDIQSYQEGIDKAQEASLDGVMIGRGIFSNPWLFNATVAEKNRDEKLKILKHHISLFKSTWGNKKNIHLLKKYFKIYATNFPEAGQIRSLLMKANSYDAMLNASLIV